jgi:hypothetical protein
VVLVIVGLTDGPEQYARAAGFAVNLWTGIALVVVAALFLVWARRRPLGIEVDADADELTAPRNHAPPRAARTGGFSISAIPRTSA